MFPKYGRCQNEPRPLRTCARQSGCVRGRRSSPRAPQPSVAPKRVNRSEGPGGASSYGPCATLSLVSHVVVHPSATVSGLLLRGLSGPVEERVFRMSVDAIDPLKGHVRGNLRLICQFLQACAQDKTKKTADADDGPSQWTEEMFREYVGVN